MRHSSTLLIFAAVTAAPAYGGGDGRLSYDLGPLLERHGLTMSQVGSVTTVVAPGDGRGWVSGSVGELKPAFLSVQVGTSGGTPVERSLKIAYNALLTQPVQYFACDPLGACAKLKVGPAERGDDVMVDGVPVGVEVLGVPCAKGLVCDIVLPSWSLEKRRQAQGAVWRSFPAVASIVDHARGVTILDAHTGEEWLTFKLRSGAGASLGVLRAVDLSGAGMLTLTYADGVVVLDFAYDRLWLVNADGLQLAAEGLGQPSPSAWQPVGKLRGNGAPVLVAADWLVFEGEIAPWAPRQSDLRRVVGTSFDTPALMRLAAVTGHGIDAASVTAGEATLWRFYAATATFTTVMTLTDVTSADQVRIHGGILEAAPAAAATPDSDYATTSLAGSKVEVQVFRQ